MIQRNLVINMVITSVMAVAGCIRYDTVTIDIFDRNSGVPIADAYITLQWYGDMIQFNAGELQSIQHGSTDEFGRWNPRVPVNLYGIASVNKSGYQGSFTKIKPNTFEDRNLRIALDKENHDSK